MKQKSYTPPKLASKLLERFLRGDLLEEVEGDLEEKFYLVLEEKSPFQARLNYLYQVLHYIRPFAIKKKKSRHSNFYDMYRNYFKIGYRNLIRNKAFSAINISGLALGMTSFLLIYLWVMEEKGVDNFHSKGANMYVMYQNIYFNEQVNSSYSTPLWFDENRYNNPAADLPEVIPEVRNVAFYATGYELPWGHPETFRSGDNLHKLEGSRASVDFFKVFDYPLIAGDPQTALADLNSIAISRKMAQLFFESPEEAMGKTLRYENRLDLIVTAVFEDVERTSTLKFDFLMNWESHMTRLGWASHTAITTVLLEEGANANSVVGKMNDFFQSRLPKDETVRTEIGLQKFSDQYLVSNFANGKPAGGRIEYVKIFSAMAIFILIAACINFMNLSTARAIRRAKEVAIRKVVGSARRNLIGQFLSESLLIAWIAMILSVALVLLILPFFNDFTGKTIRLPVSDPTFWVVLVGLSLFTGLCSGSYPAMFLSSVRPIRILKGTMQFSSGSVWFRKGLVVFQFGISIVLLITTIVISRQTDFVQTRHLGYDRENLISIRVEGTLNEKYSTFKERLSAMPGIAGVDRSSEAPQSMGFLVSEAINWEGKSEVGEVAFKPASVGFDFVTLMKLQVAEGRGFSREFATDTAAFMINEIAVKQMGMQNPIGKWISAWDKKGHIIGVLKDYHTGSLHEPIKPLILDVKEDLYFGVILVKAEPGKTREALTSLEYAYREVNPDYPLDYEFLDREYGQMYKSEQVMSKLSNASAGLAIAISCLGLLGLAMFSAEQRTREIGIRKVLGASFGHIVVVFSGGFLSLVAISFMLAAPVSWYLMNDWLQRFAYRIELSWWIFGAAGGLAFLIAVLTVSYQSVKTALANPVKSLRTE